MPAAAFVGRIWGLVQGGAEVEIPLGEDGPEEWVPFDRHLVYESVKLERTDLWEITVSQATEVEPLVRAICRRWAPARDDDFFDEPDEVGYRARYLTVVGPSGTLTDVRLVTESLRHARRSALQLYERWANVPRITGPELESLEEDLVKARAEFDAAVGATPSLPTDISVQALARAAAQLANLWGWEREQGIPSPHGRDELPVGERIAEGPPRPSPVGIGELLFFGRPLSSPEQAETESHRQLMLPLTQVRKGESTDPEWERLFEEMTSGRVSAVMEDVAVKSLVFHDRRYGPTDRRTKSATSRNLKLIASGERPWLRVRRAAGRREAIGRGSLYVVSQDYPLLKAYKESGLRFARCLVLGEDQPA